MAIGLAILLTLELSMNHRGVMRFREEHCASLLYAPALLAYTLAVALSVFLWLYYTAATPLSNPRFLLAPANLGAWLLTYVLNYAPFLLGLIFVWVPQAWESSQQPFSEGHSFRRRRFWRLAAGTCYECRALVAKQWGVQRLGDADYSAVVHHAHNHCHAINIVPITETLVSPATIRGSCALDWLGPQRVCASDPARSQSCTV